MNHAYQSGIYVRLLNSLSISASVGRDRLRYVLPFVVEIFLFDIADLRIAFFGI